MSTVSEHVESLIVRRLDGELSAEEQLELDRELIRDPAARALFERYAAIDIVAGKVLARCATPRLPMVALSGRSHRGRGRREHARGLWMIGVSAVAACLALYVTMKTPLAGRNTVQQANSTPSSAPTHLRSTPLEHTIPAVAPRGSEVGVWKVPTNQVPQVDRFVNRHLIVVPGSDGSYYLLNMDQVREVQQNVPQNTPKSGRIPAGDPI